MSPGRDVALMSGVWRQFLVICDGSDRIWLLGGMPLGGAHTVPSATFTIRRQIILFRPIRGTPR